MGWATVFHVITVLVAAVVMTTAVAHALELPGKLRLDRADYLVVQKIYYPGFTLAGVLEFPSIILLAVSAALSPLGGVEFWLRLFAALAFAGVHATYWLRIHAVNKVWLSDVELTRANTAFFGASPAGEPDAASWTKLRDRWERAHLIRAVIAGGGLIAAVAALA